MNDTGMNTSIITKVMDIRAEAISFMASIEARRADLYPASSLAWTASTTTMASSTTMAIARTSAERVMRLIENPIMFITKKVPTRATGMAMAGMRVERKSWRKM